MPYGKYGTEKCDYVWAVTLQTNIQTNNIPLGTQEKIRPVNMGSVKHT